MKCHYEVLGVARTAGDDEIKKAYKKLALRWHPDKNLDNQDEAKEQFQLIQQAWEVLSDPRERDWYDKNREAILRGKGEEYKDDAIDLFQFFSASCFKGYGDDEKGFYAVYRKVFETLAAEDVEFASEEELDEEVPGFGDSQSSYEDVVHKFYGYWQSYKTKRSYCWLNIVEARDAGNRRIQRLLEKENKKVRDKAKKERNEQVRNLVAFVRKRDKRVQAHAAELAERAKNNLKKTEERRRQQLIERQRQLKEHTESEWSKFSNMEAELKNIEANLAKEFGEKLSSDDSSNEDSIDNNALYCVACNKVFKTQKAFANHENSKKHKENVIIMKDAMEKEDEEYLDSLDTEDSANTESEPEQLKDKVLATDSQMPDFLLNPETNPIESQSSPDTSDEELMSDDEESDSQSQLEKKKKTLLPDVKPAIGPQMDDAFYIPPPPVENVNDTSDEELMSDQEDETSEEDNNRLLGKKKRKKVSAQSITRNASADSKARRATQTPNDESISEDTSKPVKRRKKPRPKNTRKLPNQNAPIETYEQDEASDLNPTSDKTPRDRAKIEKESKKQQRQQDRESRSKIRNSRATELTDLVNRCFTCNEVFSSRNKLFDHLKQTGHSLLRQETKRIRKQDASKAKHSRGRSSNEP